MKKFTKMLLISFTILGFCFPSLATTLSAPGSDNSNFVSVRKVAESLGYKVIWHADTKSVTIKDGELSTTLSLPSTTCTLSDGSTITLLESPRLVDQTLLVPLDFWSKAFQLDVTFTNGNLTITKPTARSSAYLLDDIITPLKSGVNKVYTNQKLGINLQENPSTGYTWDISFPEEVEVISNDYSSDNPSVLGSPGTHHWIIKATKPDTYTLKFKSIRASSPNEPVSTETFIIEAADFKVPTP